MRGALYVLWFELEERRALLAASLLLGLLALAAPLLPSFRQWGAADVRGVAAAAAAGALLLFATLGVGSAVLAGPVISGREGFYLARPVGSFGLWTGRVGAALAIAVLAPLLALLPVGILGAWPPGDLLRGGALPLLFAVPALIGGGTLLRLSARARTPWLAVLVVAMVVAWGIQLRLVIWPAFRFAGPTPGGSRLAPLVAVPVVWAVALLAGSLAAALRGRSDLALSARWGAGTAVASLAVLTGLLVAGFSWVRAVTPGDVVQILGVQSAPAGPWSVLKGQASRGGFHPRVSFLVDVEDGRWRRLERQWGPVSFSGDGRYLAMGEVDVDAGGHESLTSVRVLDLGNAGPEGLPVTVRTIPTDRTPFGAVLSPHGRRLLTIFGDHFTVWDVASGRPVARVREEAGRQLWAEVDDDGGVWLVLPLGERVEGRVRALQVRHLAPGGRKTVAVWRTEGLDPGIRTLHPAGEGAQKVAALFVHNGENGRSLVVRRLRTGEELWSVPLDDALTPRQVLPLEADRVVVTLGRRSPAAVTAVALLGPGGIRWRHEIQPAGYAVVRPGPAPSAVTLGINRKLGPGRWEEQTELLDLETGRSTPLGEGIFPAVAWWSWIGRAPAPAGSWGSRLFVRDGHLLLLDQDGRPKPVTYR